MVSHGIDFASKNFCTKSTYNILFLSNPGQIHFISTEEKTAPRFFLVDFPQEGELDHDLKVLDKSAGIVVFASCPVLCVA